MIELMIVLGVLVLGILFIRYVAKVQKEIDYGVDIDEIIDELNKDE